MKKNYSLSLKLYGVLFILTALSVWVGGWVAKDHFREKSDINTQIVMNNLTDHLVNSSAWYAKERGATAALLALNGKEFPQETLNLMTTSREKGDEFYFKALDAIQVLENWDSGNTWLKSAHQTLLERRRTYEDARKQFDLYAKHQTYSLTPPDWVATATAMIEAETGIRMSSFHAETPGEKALQMNVQLKHLIWKAAEYAGRERATMGPFVAAQKVVPQDVLTKLFAFRGIVENALKEFLPYKSSALFDPKTRELIAEMESAFMTKWEQRRNEVYAKAQTGHYPIDGKQWVAESTVAINSILAVGANLSTKVLADIKDEETDINRQVFLVVTIMLLSLLLSGFFAWYFKKSIITPVNLMIRQLGEGSEQVHSASGSIAGSSESLSSAATEQASALQETASSVEEMNSMVRKNAENAKKTYDLSNVSKDVAHKGKHYMDQIVLAIAEISASNKQVAEIVKVINEIGNKTKVINEIVFQTKLLSFNASVEAARAGEHGKGFAVVAEEVGNLAQMSGNAAKEIGSMLEASVQKVDGIVSEIKTKVERLVEEGRNCGSALDEIVNQVSTVNQMANEIATASEEQARGVDEITKAIGQLDQVTQQNATNANEVASAAEELSAQAGSFREIVKAMTITIQGSQHSGGAPNRAIGSGGSGATYGNSAKVIPIKPIKNVTKEKHTAAPDLAVTSQAAGAGDVPSENDPRFGEV